MSEQGVLLLNLGSPDSTSVADVRRYLDEFLSDDRVLDAPKLVQQAVLKLAILSFRPVRSAHAYEKIWTDEGSPLIVSTLKIRDKLRERLAMPVEIGMRYGSPSTESGLQRLLAVGVKKIFLIPLYPHYAMSSYETAVVQAQDVLQDIAPGVTLSIQPPFYEDEDYIDALVTHSAPFRAKESDLLLFSYHGIPERHLRKSNPSHNYCLVDAACCDKKNPAHATCYRAQVHATSRRFAEKAGLDREDWHLSFQSRLGRDPWLKPYTDKELEAFPSRGFKRLVVMCPAFISDCLETLEEIAMEGRRSFMEAGGHEFTYIPCLNDDDVFIDVLERMVGDWQMGRLCA